MALVEPIRVEGLKEFTRAVKKTDRDLPKAVRLAGNSAAEIVVNAARPRVPRRSGRAAGSIKARSTQSEARVSEGGGRAVYMPWLDFGGRVGRKHATKRPFIKKGRYIWAAFADHIPEIQEKMADSLAEVARQAGLEVSK